MLMDALHLSVCVCEHIKFTTHCWDVHAHVVTVLCMAAGAAFLEVPHDSESSTGGSGSAESLPEDAALNPAKPSVPGKHLSMHCISCVLDGYGLSTPAWI